MVKRDKYVAVRVRRLLEAFKDEASRSRLGRDLMGEAAGAEPDKKRK